MSWNSVIPAWVITVGITQDRYRDGVITYEDAVAVLDSMENVPEGCYEVLEDIKRSLDGD